MLIWNSIPAPGQNDVPADVVLGAPDFTTVIYGNVVDNKSLLGPQGIWIQNGKLYVADTRHHRIMIWNSIPTQNYAAADTLLGQPNFSTSTQQFVGQAPVPPAANNMLNPVSVSSDGTRLFVADLGQNRVLIWNTIPTQMDQAADVELGEPDMVTNGYDPVTQAYITNMLVCQNAGQDPNQNNTVVYPPQCAATIQLPRAVISDGSRLFVADGGSDRVLIWNHDSNPERHPSRHCPRTAGYGLGRDQRFDFVLHAAVGGRRTEYDAHSDRTCMGRHEPLCRDTVRPARDGLYARHRQHRSQYWGE